MMTSHAAIVLHVLSVSSVESFSYPSSPSSLLWSKLAALVHVLFDQEASYLLRVRLSEG